MARKGTNLACKGKYCSILKGRAFSIHYSLVRTHRNQLQQLFWELLYTITQIYSTQIKSTLRLNQDWSMFSNPKVIDVYTLVIH